MPAVPKTSEAEIVAAARRLIERHGSSPLSMQALAAAVGVQAPSLYKRFPDRAAILQAVARSVLQQLALLQKKAATSGSPEEDLRAMAQAHRRFAHRSPHLYGLVFGADKESELGANEYAASLTVLMDRVRSLGSPESALDNTRLLVAFVHGFCSMEMAGAFHLGGDLDRAYDYGVDRILSAIAAAPRRKR